MGGISVPARLVRPVPRFNAGSTRALFVALVLVATAGGTAGASPAGAEGDERRRYLVILSDHSSADGVAAEHRRRYGADVHLIYRHAIRGYAAELPAQALEGISRDPRVAFIEPDATVQTTAQTSPTGIGRISAPANTTIDIDGSDDVRIDVDIAILDTGLDPQHPDLNVASISDCTLAGTLEGCAPGEGKDEHGHGTHVAGTAAALDNDQGVVGVAPGARLHGVKVLSRVGTGLMSWVIAGVDWVSSRADLIEVANMSLGCDCPSEALDQAIANSVERGVVYTVSAGNNGRDTARYSPANHPDVITVSALADFDGSPGGRAPTSSCDTSSDDVLAEFSNWGPHVEVAAPGVCILSTAPLGRYRTMSGTSMAAPHVAGAAAILTSGANDPRDGDDVATVRNVITGWGAFDWTDASGDGIQEPLLNIARSDVFAANSNVRTLGSASPEPQPAPSPSPTGSNQAPVARFVYSCSDLVCSFDAGPSSDADGSVSRYTWSFGDGTAGTGATASKTYGNPGTYTVRLEVADDAGATSTASQTIAVSEAAPVSGDESITLAATGARLYGRATVELKWQGSDRAGTIAVYRNGVEVYATADDGEHVDVFEGSSGPVTYRICETGTTRCSNEVRLFG